jgi:tRNA threonylcarbamoyl adenosine modification protein (Sua5/YciO/YrdC/YwlC family)
MIQYVIPSNIDDRVPAKAARVLGGGGLVALPTDTSWSLACSLKSPAGIKKLRKLYGERDERHFTLLCSDISQFGVWCSLDNSRFRLIKRLSPGPYVFILKTLLGTEKALGSNRRREAGVRIPGHPVPLAVIEALGSPLYSITAKKSMQRGTSVLSDLGAGLLQEPEYGEAADNTDAGELPPVPEEDLFEGAWELEDIDGVDLIIDDGGERERIFSTILDISGEDVKPLRMGAGPWPV